MESYESYMGNGDPEPPTSVDDLAARAARAISEGDRAFAGPYGLLAAALQNAEEHLREYGESFARRGHSSSLGTQAQDLILLEAARLVVGNPNGCRERFACLLRAVAESQGLADYVTPVLARKPWDSDSLVEVRPADHWAERQDEAAREIVAEGIRQD